MSILPLHYQGTINCVFIVLKTHFLVDSKFPAGLIYRGNLKIVLFNYFKACPGWIVNPWSLSLSYLNLLLSCSGSSVLFCSLSVYVYQKVQGKFKKSVLNLLFTIVSKSINKMEVFIRMNFYNFFHSITFLRLNYREYLLIKSQKNYEICVFLFKEL